jgi:hypothetical protein
MKKFVGLCYFREGKRKREREVENKRKLKTGKIYDQDTRNTRQQNTQ